MAGRKVWAADEVLSADDLQEYIQDQVVFVYESSGARASGILAPTEGMVSYLKDTNQVSVYNGTAWVDIAPDVGTPGTYTKVTTDFKGRVTAGTTLAAGDIPTLDASKISGGNLNVNTLNVKNSSNVNTIQLVGSNGSSDFTGNMVVGGNVGIAGSLTNVGQTFVRTLNVQNSSNINTIQLNGFNGSSDFTGGMRVGGVLELLNTLQTTGVITSNNQIFTSNSFRATGDCWVDGTLIGGGVSAGASGVGTSGNIVGAATYNQTNTGRAMFVNSAGLYGIGASSRRFKENIVDADIDTGAVLDIRVRKFNYKKSFDETMPKDIGVIAEELEDLGLTDFIYYDAEGIPDGVAYEKLALALIPVLKKQQAQIDSVVARLDELEK